MIFFTSDLHMFHHNILPRRLGFSSLKEMQDSLKENWNSVVGASDTVILAGDIFVGGVNGDQALLEQFNGTKILIRGNHDRKQDLKHFSLVTTRMDLRINELDVSIIHNPFKHPTVLPEFRGTVPDLVLCGHVHEKWRIKRKGDVLTSYGLEGVERPVLTSMYNVGVDVNGFTPLSIDTIVSNIRKFKDLQK